MSKRKFQAKNIIFLGMPGSGKGTQAEILAQKINIPIISTGNLFRKNIAEQTDLGKRVKDILNRGDLVSDEITFQMIESEIKAIGISSGLILDGYPRSVAQANLLKNIIEVDVVLNIELSEEQALIRIGGRRTCKCGETYHIKFNPPKIKGICDKCGQKLYIRDDAQEETIKNRLRVYKEQTEPLIEYYRDKVIDIDGNLSIPEVSAEIFSKLGI